VGLLDLPAPLFNAIDGTLALALPAVVRLALWGVFAGWLTMLVYRRLSNQEKIGRLKAEQKVQQKQIAEFDGELSDLMPLVGQALGTGFRQLGLSLGPALLSAVPVLFLIVWVAGTFAYELPKAGDTIAVTTEPAAAPIEWQPAGSARASADGWLLAWPGADESVRITSNGDDLLRLPLEEAVPVIHQRQWWNLLMSNPIGYLPAGSIPSAIHLQLPERSYLGFGADWMRGWMFSFFVTFLVASVAFKFLLKID
jgi:hypothetical protein